MPSVNSKIDGSASVGPAAKPARASAVVQRPLVSAMIRVARGNGCQVKRPPFVSGSNAKGDRVNASLAEKTGVAVNRTVSATGPSTRQENTTVFPA